MNEIKKTGYWSGETAHVHHVHCKELSKWISRFLKEKDKITYDFGCGLGNYLKDLKENGFTNLVGYEGDIPKMKEFDLIIKKDLTVPFLLPVKGNVISLEVGEHIPKKYQDVYIDNITNNCDDYLIISWAIEGQPGFGHVNCQNNQYIIDEIEKRGFKYLKEESKQVRDIDLSSAPWFKNTLLLFKKV